MGRVRNRTARNLRVEDIGLGIENTKTRAELCAITGLCDSQLRIQIQRMKERGVIICSSCNRKGYFRPRKDRPEELEIAKADYKERERKAKSMLLQMKHLKRFIGGDDQLELIL